MEQMYQVWVEIQANKQLILDKEQFQNAVEKCKKSGMTGIILSVKDTTGFVLYKSKLAEHYAVFDRDFLPEIDYVQQCFEIIRNQGLKCYAAFDVFAEGNKEYSHPSMKGFLPGWECEVYGLDENDNAAVLKSTEAKGLRTIGSIDDFGEIFVNPGNVEVCEYEICLIEEFAANYHPDGIVLDRVRYVGLSSDFSEKTREAWEKFSGVSGENWPEDIYQIIDTGDGLKEVPGKYFGSFFEYRASIIKNFMKSVKRKMSERFPEIEFCNYTGSWYPLYHQVGANWASNAYESTEFPWCDKERLRKTGYAELPDRLLSGFYYSDVWIIDGRENGSPEDWYSVEGACELATKVTKEKEGLVGSLFIEQYEKCPERLPEAMSICFEKTSGCMLFDLSYIMKYNWWNYMKKVALRQVDPETLSELTELCERVFGEEYHITKEKLENNLFGDAEFSWQESKKLIDEESGEMIGFIGVKVSSNQQLYPNTAWISLFAIDKGQQRKGYGRLLLNQVCRSLETAGIKKVYLGQDFNNFFSGIPNPDEKKEHFFKELKFVLNTEWHFDLEADIINNAKIEQYDASSFEKDYLTCTYQNEKAELLGFLEREFPGRWVFEAEEALENGKDPSNIVLLWDREKTEILGYCMLSIDEKGYGGLGPIGIAKKIRGKHVGDYILYKSLRQLQKNGAIRVNIDWTVLKDFYGQFDFCPKRTYMAAYREMNE